MGVPIVIGVTGHRDLREKDIALLQATVREELAKLRNTYLHSEFVMLNSLAAGADMLCAEVALELGMHLACPLPFSVDEYRADFHGADLERFEDLLKRADQVFVAPFTEAEPAPAVSEAPKSPTLSPRDFRYRQAGIYVATHCHVLLALWDGVPGDANGCGTAQAVRFMLEGNFQGAAPFDAEGDGAVIHITCPRQSCDQDQCISAKLVEERAGALKQTLARTDAFNTDCGVRPHSVDAGEQTAGSALPSKVDALKAVYDDADRLSLLFQKRYLRALWWLSLFCVLLVMAFLLYDEAEMQFMLVAWAVIIVAYAVFYRIVVNGKYHQKYIQYRVLAEATRVQGHLTSLGMANNVGNDFTWTQRHDIAWVRKALDALLIGEPAPATATPDQVKAAWVDDQRAYHEKACVRDGGKLAGGDRVTQAMLVGTVIVFLAITVLEYGFPTVMDSTVLGLGLRAWGKIVWGCLSAVVLFVAGYYGRLSFERKAFDHEKMALLFAAAARRFEAAPARYRDIFSNLAREEIIENGNWMSYCKEDRPTFSL